MNNLVKNIVLLIFVLIATKESYSKCPIEKAIHHSQVSITPSQKETKSIDAAREVLKRILGNKSRSINLEIIQSRNGVDTYEYEAKNGLLTVKGSSTVAILRGIYDYLQSQGIGMFGWSGPQFRIPDKWPDKTHTSVTSPFRIRQAYNVVTAGYTTPYWTWQRWEQELDWEAIHGFNMLLAPVATEAIATRVWKRLGLTQQEIDSFYVGPAHLPWQRMGNICQVGGTLPPQWHIDQIALQHQILQRMRELGIEPVVQSFAGFVPKAITRLYPNLVLHNTLWNSGFTPSQRPVILMPGDPLFAKITKLYMEEWNKEFGEATYYLVDSFNEMELPKTDRPVTDLLAEYGQKTYEAILSGNPKANWVIQGWMFGYQSDIWSPDRVKALFSKVPDNRVLILDYANDYANNWEPHNGFNGKQWAYGFVPNMGGKTAYTGNMNLYATGAAGMVASPKKNNLVGFSLSGEGLENNEVLYELLTHTAWSKEPVNLDIWLKDYSINRYGAAPEALMESWNLMRKSCYQKLEPHPQLGWQLGKCGTGSVNRDTAFFKATELFLSCRKQFAMSNNYKADAIERAAITLGLKADDWFKAAADAYKIKDTLKGNNAGKRGLELLTELDRLMESHPLNRLERWIGFARSHSQDPKLQQFYESNARQIVTIWGPPVNDYSCRIWSGLVRDYYRERMAKILSSLKTGIRFNRKLWEQDWVNGSGVSPVTPYEDPVATAQILVTKALNEKIQSDK